MGEAFDFGSDSVAIASASMDVSHLFDGDIAFKLSETTGREKNDHLGLRTYRKIEAGMAPSMGAAPFPIAVIHEEMK